MLDLKLFTTTFTKAEQLHQLWEEVPTEARGYTLTLKHFDWHSECTRELALDQVLEARFFWQGGEASWQAFQTYDGQCHSRHYRAVLICGKEAVRGFQRQDASYKDKPAELMLFDAMMDKELEGLNADDLPAILTQAWQDADDQPLYWQWLKVVAGKVVELSDGGES